MKKILLSSIFLSLITLQAETTMCYKENLSTPAVSEDTPLDGGKCNSQKSVNDMIAEGWEVNDIKISQSKSGMNFTYVFKIGELSTDTKAMSEEELIARITERMTQQKKEQKKIEKEKQRAIAKERIKEFYTENCQQCHGQKGELKAYNVSRKLKDLSVKEIQISLTDYTNGYRRGAYATLMLPYANIMTDNKAEDLYIYLQSLNPKEEEK